MVGINEKTVEGLLYNLIELDYDAAEAYEAAINRVENDRYKQKLLSFHEDHIKHTKNLGEILLKMGKNIPDGADIKRILTQGKVVLANLIGNKTILSAIKSNAEDVETAYGRALKHNEVTPKISEILTKNLEDLKKHCQWISAETK